MPEGPRRIVSMAPALTEILFAVGAGERVVGVTTYCDYPAEARALPEIGGYANPSVEAILALDPDLVLVSPAAGNREAALAVRRAGVRLEVVPARTLEDTFTAIEKVASLCGVEQRGRELVRSIRRRLDAVRERTRSDPRVRTLFCLQLDPLVAAGRGTLPGELVELAGGENVITAERYPRIGMETVLDLAPEVVIQARMDTPEPSAAAAARGYWSRWGSVPAVRDGRVYVVDGSTALRPGPRVADGAETLARLLHAPHGGAESVDSPPVTPGFAEVWRESGL